MEELEELVTERIELITTSGKIIKGEVLGCTSAIDNDGEESIDILEDETDKIYSIFANEIQEIKKDTK